MLQVTLAEKIGILVDIIKSSPIFICITIFTIILNIALYKNSNTNKKILKKVFMIFYILIFSILFIQYNKTVISILDYLVENILKLVYFPNLAAYIFMIIIANIIMVITMLKDTKKSIKLINTTTYTFIMLLFILTIFTVFKNEVNVYEMFSVYTNKDLLVLIELSSFTFIIWGICIILNKVINFVTVKIDSKEANIDTVVEKVKVKEIKVVESKETTIPTNKAKTYDGPIIDTPSKKQYKLPSYSIIKKFNDYLDAFIDSLFTKKEVTKPVVTNPIPTPIITNTSDLYIEKAEDKKPTKYIIVDEIKANMENYSEPKKDVIISDDMTLQQCYEIRNILLSLQQAEKAK